MNIEGAPFGKPFGAAMEADQDAGIHTAINDMHLLYGCDPSCHRCYQCGHFTRHPHYRCELANKHSDATWRSRWPACGEFVGVVA